MNILNDKSFNIYHAKSSKKIFKEIMFPTFNPNLKTSY